MAEKSVLQQLNDALGDSFRSDNLAWEEKNARYFDLTDLVEYLKTVKDAIGTSVTLARVKITTDGAITTNGPGYYAQEGTGGATVTLASADANEGTTITVKDEGGNAGTNPITVDTEGSETIDDSTSDSIGSDYESRTYLSDGTNWHRI